MTSSPEAKTDGLPPALPSMWRLCQLGYRHEPSLMLAAFVLALGGRYQTMFDLQAQRFNAVEDEEGTAYDVLA